MPEYDYHCKSCGQAFTIRAGMKESRTGVACSACQGQDVMRVFAGIAVKRGAPFPLNGHSAGEPAHPVAQPSCRRCSSPDPCGAG